MVPTCAPDGGSPARRALPSPTVTIARAATPQPPQLRRRSRRADEVWQRAARLAVAVAAEVDPRQDDLAVTLADTFPHLAQHGFGGATPGGTANQWNYAERTGKAAAVLHAYERAHAVELRLRLHAADRADVAGDELRRLLATTSHYHDVV